MKAKARVRGSPTGSDGLRVRISSYCRRGTDLLGCSDSPLVSRRKETGPGNRFIRFRVMFSPLPFVGGNRLSNSKAGEVYG